MATDPNIIFQLGRGVTPLLSPAEVQNQQIERESGMFKMNALRQSAQDDAAYRSVLQSGASPDQIPNRLFQAGLGKQGQEFQKFNTDQQKTQADTRKAKLEAGIKQFEAIGQIMSGVRDQPTYDLARQQVATIVGPEAMANIPAVYDAATVQRNQQQAMSVKDRMAQQLQGSAQDITKRGQDLSRQTALETNANTVGVARDRLSYDQGQPKGQVVQTENGPMLLDTRTAEARPITSGGAPVKGASSAKMTEDQGKATGWLVQAENAFQNMQASGFDEKGNPKSAAKPGFADAIATVPFVGAAAGNSMRTPDRQKFVQAASSLSESLLRAATGAGVNRDEAKQKIEELTPQWGEDDTTTKQKMAAIPLYIESLKVRAGPGAAQASAINAGGGAPAAGSNSPRGGLARPANEAAFSALPSGTLFVAPDGTTRRKP